MKRSSLSIFSAAVFTVAVTASPSVDAHKPGHANHHNPNHHHWNKHHSEHPADRHRHGDAGIALAVGAVALIAAVAAAKAHQHSDVYGTHHGYGAKDNAIAACLHKAQRRTVKRGGYGVSVKRLNEARRTSQGWSISLRVKQRTRRGTRNRYANCIVEQNRVTSFNWA